MYLFYSHNDATLGLVSQLSEFTANTLGLTVDPTTERKLITIPKPNGETNHNGGNLAFGLDGLLYAGLGDGGGGNDQHGAIGNAQSTNTAARQDAAHQRSARHCGHRLQHSAEQSLRQQPTVHHRRSR